MQLNITLSENNVCTVNIYIYSKHISYWLIIDKMLLSKFAPNIYVTPYLRDFSAHRLYRILNIQKIGKH